MLDLSNFYYLGASQSNCPHSLFQMCYNCFISSDKINPVFSFILYINLDDVQIFEFIFRILPSQESKKLWAQEWWGFIGLFPIMDCKLTNFTSEKIVSLGMVVNESKKTFLPLEKLIPFDKEVKEFK